MPKPPSTWKDLERFVPKYLSKIWPGGERTHWAPEDCRVGPLSIECKHGKTLLSKRVEKAWKQAEKNAGENIPALVLHKKYKTKNSSLICLRLDDFRNLLLSLMGKDQDTTKPSRD